MWLRNTVTLILCLIYTFNITNGEYSDSSSKVSEEDAAVFQTYMDMDKQLKELVSYGIKRALPMMLEGSESMNLTAKCMGNILLLTTGIRKLKLSALSFLDASGKPSAGILEGSMHMLGDYDQCLESYMERRRGEIAFRGKYCLVHYSSLLPKQKRPITFDSGNEELVEATRNASELVRFLASTSHFFYFSPAKLGVCLPTGCNDYDVSQMVKYVSELLTVNATLAYCDDDTDVFWDSANIAFACCLVVVGVLVVCGTILDYYSKINIQILKSSFVRILMCFSFITNFPKAITTKTPTNNISCLNGIRALTLFYVILLHQYYANVKYYISSRSIQALAEIPQFFFQIVGNGFLTADVFFFVGGLVNCYTRVKKSEDETQKTTFLKLYLGRIIRTGLPYTLFSFLMALFRPHGPMKLFQIESYVEKCEKYWWQNLLFINNYFLQDNTCVPHSWFIAADLQLFILSLLTVPILLKSPKKGIVLNCAVIMGGIVCTIIWSWVNEVTPTIVFYRPNVDEIDRAWRAHTLPFPHIAPYFTGILMGYFLATKQSIHISKIHQMIGWPVAAFLFISMLFMTKIWNSGGTFTVVDSSFYFGFSKFLFVLGIAWMVLCCTTGNGGVINYILSLPVWIPIARISYLTYLVAPFLQNFYFANSKTDIDVHRMPLIWRYAGDVLLSCLFGLLMHILLEAPFSALQKRSSDKKPALVETVIKPENILKNDATEMTKAVNNELEINEKKVVSLSVKNAIL